METDVLGRQSRVVLKTVRRMPRTFLSQFYAVDMAVACWVSLGSFSYAACAFYLANQNGGRSCKAGLTEQVASVEWTFQVQTAAFGAVLLLNLLNLGMRQHLLPFKCNLLLLFINGVAFVTDLLLWRGATTVLLSSSGRPFAPLRYVQWCHSTPTMIYMLALLADCSGWELTVSLLSDVVMVATGMAACYTRGGVKDLMTVISFGTFTVVLYYVHGLFQKTLSSDVSPEQRSTLRTVLALLMALWSAFPVVWLAADWHLMSPQAEAVCWGVCDYLAKVVFSSQLWQSNLTEVQLRRDRALEAWEAHNRVEAVARLTGLLKQRDDLLSTLSHELRTPLAGIVALSEGLCQEVSAALPSSAQNLATVRATATCMLSIVTSTLDSFAARRDGEPDGAPHLGDEAHGPVAASVPLSPLDLRPLVDSATTVLRPLAHDGVAVVSDLPSNLPLVAADATRLSQVLYNLIGNAMRFTTHGEVRVAARVVLPEGLDAASGRVGTTAATTAAATTTAAADYTTPISSGGSGGGSLWRYARPRLSQSSASSCSSVSFPSGTQVEVSVEDTGIGIAQELLDELFLPYRTGHTAQGREAVTGRTSRSIGGTGLGLYLVRLALRAQGSDVTAESAPGIGSVFRFRLQVAQQQQQQQPISKQDHQGRNVYHVNGTAPLSPPQPRIKTQQQQHHMLLGDEPLSQQPQQHHGDDESGSQVHLSGSTFACGEVISNCPLSSEGSGAERMIATPSSPKPLVPSSPRPWIASAAARLANPSVVTTALGRRAAGCGNGGGGVAAAPPLVPEYPACSDALLLHESPSPLHRRPLRMSLDDQQHRNPRLPLSKQPVAPSSSAGGLLKAGCGGKTFAAEPSPAVACGGGACSCTARYAESLGIATPAAAAADGLPCTVDSGWGGGAGIPVTTTPPSVMHVMAPALTAIQTPTNAMTSRLSTTTAMSLVEEGRACTRPGMRPNFRHRNNGTLQVLSVDDDPINQLVAGQMLSSQSWKVVKCMNGPEALAHLQLISELGTTAVTAAAVATAAALSESAAAATPATASLAATVAAAAQPLLLPAVLPDCVLLDVMMPGMSGFEVCRKLRQYFSSAQLPIIIVSAKGDSAAVDEAFDSGADDYMTKPYKRTEMVARIKAQIRTRDSVLDAVTAKSAAAAPAAMPPALPAELPSSTPPPATAATATAASAGNTLLACSATTAAVRSLPEGGTRMLPGCSDAMSELPYRKLSPPQPLSQPQPQHDSRPTSVDVLSLRQPTPDSIKNYMEASRGGLDGSWGKVGLYNRSVILNRTGLVEGTTTKCDAAGLHGGTLREPGTDAVSPQVELQQMDAGRSTAAATCPATAVGPPDSDKPSLNNQLTGSLLAAELASAAVTTADVAVGTSKPLPILPKATVALMGEELAAATAITAVPGSGVSAGAASGQRQAASIAPARPSSDGESVTAAGIVSAMVDATDASEDVEDEITTADRGSGSSGGGGADGGNGETAAATALMRELLMEVRRNRVAETDMEKLTSRVAALRTACGTLAAERDGWRRQARDLRALLAAGLSGAAVAAAASAAAQSGSMSLPAKAGSATPSNLTFAEALPAAHGSCSSGDSLGVAGGGAGGGAQGSAQNGAVAAQLEDLKKEAALLRQQLSVALAGVGGGSIAPGNTETTDAGGIRAHRLTSSGPDVRPRSALLALPGTSDSPHSAANAGVGNVDPERSGGCAGDGAPPWGVSGFPNAAFAPPSDMFLITEASGLSAGSGLAGAACDGSTSGEGGCVHVKSNGAAAPSPHSLLFSAHPSMGAEGRQSKRLFLRPASSGSAAAPEAVPTTRVGLAAAAVTATTAKQANGVGGNAGSCNGGATAAAPSSGNGCVAPLTASCGGAVPTAENNGAMRDAAVAMAAAAASLPQPPPLPLPKADSPQVPGGFRGSSTAGNGGPRVTTTPASGEEGLCRASSSAVGVPVPTSPRSSRFRGGGGGAASTAGILRMLCGKGASLAASPDASNPRRNSYQQQQQLQQQ